MLTGWGSFHQRNNSFPEHNTLFSEHMQPSSYNTIRPTRNTADPYFTMTELSPINKPTDKHQHLLSSSRHPHHTKKAIPFSLHLSLALRLRRICSTDAKFNHRINELKTYLLARGYNNNFLEKQFLRAANISRTKGPTI